MIDKRSNIALAIVVPLVLFAFIIWGLIACRPAPGPSDELNALWPSVKKRNPDACARSLTIIDGFTINPDEHQVLVLLYCCFTPKPVEDSAGTMSRLCAPLLAKGLNE